MFHLGVDHNEPIKDDGAKIAAYMQSQQKPLRVVLSLAGAAAGMYVAFQLQAGPVVYVGIVAGMGAFYKLFGLLMQLGRQWGAKSYEIINHQPSSTDD